MHPLRLEAVRLAEGVPQTPTNMTRVAKQTDHESAAWAFVQWDLRAKAAGKFGQAAQMFFVKEALEQATHERVAEYHASLFPAGETVIDLTAGIGSDLIALAKRGPAIGFELDRERADCARWNLEALGLQADVRQEDSVAWLRERGDVEYAVADPARRMDGRRTLNIEEFAPNPVEIGELFGDLKLGIIKLSPLLSDDLLQELGRGVQFVSFGGECREALVMCGSEAKSGMVAVHIESGEVLEEGMPVGSVPAPLEYMFDCDAAAVRAHGTSTLCAQYGLRPLADSVGYLTGADAVESPWLRCYRVLETDSFDLKRLRGALKRLDSATPILKQRSTGLDLDKLRKDLKSEGERPLIVIFYLVGKSIRYAITEIQNVF